MVNKLRRITLAVFTACALSFAWHNVARAQSLLENQLVEHPSPYLALHGSDPVRWQDFSDETVELARAEDKLLFVSLGYFSCHWCHVMQRESYQDDGVAELINEFFIPIKVDRELNPAIDAALMEFAVELHGRGGWPLNVFLTPEGHPLAAVFYRPRDNFHEILGRLNAAWTENREQLRLLARKEAGDRAERAGGTGSAPLGASDVTRFVDSLSEAALAVADTMSGGFGEGAKFPQTPQLDFLLAQHLSEPSPRIVEFLTTTLDAMASRGLRDHIGGGFFRYCVDPDWGVPHFEKMLYGNALLADLYLRAGMALDNPRWIDVARDTLDFMIREMQTKSGGMVAAFSAIDANDVEGGYYLFDPDELAELLDDEQLSVANAALSFDEAPTLDGKFLPYRDRPLDTIATSLELTEAALHAKLDETIAALAEARATRELPTDTKLLAGWNGLALNAVAGAAAVLDDEKYRDAAQAIRDFLISQLWRDDELWRAAVAGTAVGAASLEDYAYVGQGLVRYAELTGHANDWSLAHAVLDQGWRRFHRDDGWVREEQPLIGLASVRPVLDDGALSSPSAVMIGATAQLIASDHASKMLSTDALDALQQRMRAASEVSAAYLEDNLFQYATFLTIQAANQSL